MKIFRTHIYIHVRIISLTSILFMGTQTHSYAVPSRAPGQDFSESRSQKNIPMRSLSFIETSTHKCAPANINSKLTDIKKLTHNANIKRAIVIGASSGMGRQVAKLLATEGGYEVGLVARRTELLETLQKEIPTKTYIKQIDVTEQEEARTRLLELISEMGGLDLILISISAFGDLIDMLSKEERDARTMSVDLLGFWAMADIAVDFFEKQKSGHLVGISSISGVRGDAHCPVYSGAKAFISRYLEGIRNYMIQSNIPVYVTDIMPGWVDNERIKFSELPNTYWVTPLDKAGHQIYEAIQNKDKIAYISKRQILVKWALETAPDWLYNGVGGF
ncbi:MAG: SDR family NAD(P)-dependent oxidoreductase [bacterium]